MQGRRWLTTNLAEPHDRCKSSVLLALDRDALDSPLAVEIFQLAGERVHGHPEPSFALPLPVVYRVPKGHGVVS